MTGRKSRKGRKALGLSGGAFRLFRPTRLFRPFRLAAALLVAVTTAASGQQPRASQRCVIELVGLEREGTRVEVSPGQVNFFGGGNARFRCRNQPIHMRSDSVAIYQGNLAQFIGKVRRPVRRVVASWTGIYQYTIDKVLEDMIGRCRELKLRLAVPEEQARHEFTVLLTVQTMNYLHSGRHRVAL